MTRTLTIVYFIIFVVLSTSAAAQEEVLLDKFQVIIRSGELEGVEGVLDGTSLQGYKLDGTPINIPRNEIRNLYAYKGSKAGPYALAGAGFGFLTSLLGVLSAYGESAGDPYREVKEDRIVPIVAGFTVGGALIGGLIGLGHKTMERVPVRGRPSISSRNGGVQLAFSVPF